MEFPRDLMLAERTVPPWEIPDHPISYVETGRQALHLIGSHLWEQGIYSVLLPDYLCESMAAPFSRLGYKIVFYPVDLTGTPDLIALKNIIDAQKHPYATLLTKYFGNEPTADDHDALLLLKNRSYTIIDETHSLFAATRLGGSIAFASLRKLLPVPDGAYIRGDIALKLTDSIKPARLHGRLEAMRQKSASRDPDAPIDLNYRTAFAEANRRLTESHEPHSLSDTTHLMLQRLNYPLLRDRRKENARQLAVEIGKFSTLTVVNMLSMNSVPSYLVIAADKPAILIQSHLARLGIYCPIHWPRVPAARIPKNWPTNVISLPIDHRYSKIDMQTIADSLRQSLEQSVT